MRRTAATLAVCLAAASPAAAAPTIQEFPLPDPMVDEQPQDLVLGPDGNTGRYRMTMTARDAAGNVSSPDRVRFRLLPRVRR